MLSGITPCNGMLSLHIQNLYIVRFYSVHTLFDSILTEPIHCRCMEFFPFPGNCSKYGNKFEIANLGTTVM